MSPANHDTPTDRVDHALRQIASATWNGPDRHPRVESLIKERQTMRTASFLRRHPIALGIGIALSAGAVGAAVTHQVMSQQAVLRLDNGTEMQVEVVPQGDPSATGTFVTDDGRTFGIRTLPDGSTQIDTAEGAASFRMAPDQAENPPR